MRTLNHRPTNHTNNHQPTNRQARSNTELLSDMLVNAGGASSDEFERDLINDLLNEVSTLGSAEFSESAVTTDWAMTAVELAGCAMQTMGYGDGCDLFQDPLN